MHHKFTTLFRANDGDGGGLGLVDTDCPKGFAVFFDRVRSKDVKGIGMLIMNNLIDLFAAHRNCHEDTCCYSGFLMVFLICLQFIKLWGQSQFSMILAGG